MNVYESRGVQQGRDVEFKNATRTWNESKDFNGSKASGGVYNSSFAEARTARSMFENESSQNQNQQHHTMAGTSLSSSEFVHTNMTPFFGARIRQNTDLEKSNGRLETFTGISPLQRNKVEQTHMFTPENNIHNPYGQQSVDLKDRIIPGQVQNNVLPPGLRQELVGPGLNQGYGSAPDGGFQQFERHEMPKNVDELRTANNPKYSYAQPIAAAKATVTNRGTTGKLNRNQPALPSEWGIERTNKGNGGPQGATEWGEMEMKCTTRPDTHVPYSGITTTSVSAITGRQEYEETDRPELKPFGEYSDNKTALTHANPEDNYARDSRVTYANERQVTGVRSLVNNLTAAVKSVVTPISDLFRTTKKEYFVDAAQQFGQMHASMPSKATVYDPNETARTTLKETLIHDTTINNLYMPNQNYTYDPDIVANTTVRETLDLTNPHRNMRQAVYKTTIYDPDDIAKTTISETMLSEPPSGQADRSRFATGAYTAVASISTPLPTQKQFLSDQSYEGQIKMNQGQGHLVAVIGSEPKATQKSFLSDNDYFGGGDGQKSEMHIGQYENVITSANSESLLEMLPPTNSGVKLVQSKDGLSYGYNKNKESTCVPRANAGYTVERGDKRRADVKACEVTRQPQGIGSTDFSSRFVDPVLVSSFLNNPYTQSLNSF